MAVATDAGAAGDERSFYESSRGGVVLREELLAAVDQHPGDRDALDNDIMELNEGLPVLLIC